MKTDRALGPRGECKLKMAGRNGCRECDTDNVPSASRTEIRDFLVSGMNFQSLEIAFLLAWQISIKLGRTGIVCINIFIRLFQHDESHILSLDL